jgi:hypothetical protein
VPEFLVGDGEATDEVVSEADFGDEVPEVIAALNPE